MKFLIVALFLIAPKFVFAQTPLMSATAVLTWDSNPEPDMHEYIILMGNSPGAYSSTSPVLHVQGVKNQTGEFNNLVDEGIYYFAVKACDVSGNCSAPSQEVAGRVIIPPGIPTNPSVIIKINIGITIP